MPDEQDEVSLRLSSTTFTSPQTVLVVDDDVDVLHLLSETLAHAGYEPVLARDGDEAWLRLELLVPDAILLDGVMPGEHGFAWCRRFKAQAAWAHVPVIFMTGLSETASIVEGFAAGGVDYVVKPLKMAEVLARLATHVHNASISRLAREAVDVAGMGVVLLDQQGRMAWCSPIAKQWFVQLFGAKRGDSAMYACLQQVVQQGTAYLPLADGQRVLAQSVGAGGWGEHMLVLRRVAADHGRMKSAALTPRESEVLSWLAKGKTNRDIADILGMSPRTVNKHLEHVFEKLGVETRTAAVAIANRWLGN